MHAFLSRIMRVRSQAIIMAALSLILPPFGFVGGGIMGLATLRNGIAEGALVGGAAMSLAAAAAWVLLGTPAPIVVFMVVTGLPILLLAATLHHTRSLATTMTVAAFCAVIVVIILQVAVDDPLAWWQEQLRAVLIQPAQGPDLNAETTGNLEKLIGALAPMMIGLPAGVMFGAILTLFLSRWWHAILDNPGGFRREFHDLRLDSRLAIATIIIGCIVTFVDRTSGIGNGFLQILVFLYLFQGLAIFHGITAERNASRGWLVGLYALLLLFTDIVMAFLVIIGIIDTWVDFRTRAMDKHKRNLRNL
uniref:Predicted membrane protein (DUF2232) n=1 Tax=Candidatus Kentrum sp. MB TaxID=2138164 RepID=A0A450XDA5_9GAMM|nr:MAG: Predicted membrane protein (DUF2232) [Candidatus Kentron sp. MB]VFK27251.1 MAG: Predicted membrane protein (DUF2232) [Candidatus Kentron sp. MB]VFK75112.1 MAG: Predicted membrane protein (DUF2232) [Candidatus Kentron sp. MB]